MEWIETPESSNISRLGYDEPNRVLKIEFKNGSLYDYFDVPVNIFEEIRNAPSKGQYLAQQVKGIFRYARA